VLGQGSEWVRDVSQRWIFAAQQQAELSAAARYAIPECRFHPRLLRELIHAGDLNETDGCPLRRVCQVEEGKDERKNRDVQFSGSGHLSDRYQGLGKPLRFVLRPERGLGSV